MCALNDSLGDCWAGPDKHRHRKFEDQSSSPFWTNQPDPQNPEYCLPNEELSEKPKETTWQELKWKGRTYAHVCKCGTCHVVPSDHPVCPHPDCSLNPLKDQISSVTFCRKIPAFGHRVNQTAKPPAEFGTAGQFLQQTAPPWKVADLDCVAERIPGRPLNAPDTWQLVQEIDKGLSDPRCYDHMSRLR